MASVLFFAPSAYLLSGLATWLDYLVPGLAEAGWDSRLALVSGPHHHRPERYLQAHPQARTVVAHCATGTAEGRARAVSELLEAERPDLAVSVNIPDLFAAINRRRLHGLPAPLAVMSVHGIEAFLYADARRYRKALDAVICSNRLACALTESLGGIETRRILYAPYGVLKPEPTSRALAGDRLRIVHSGRLETPQKRARDLVGIVHSLKRRGVPFELEIAGDGPDRKQLEDDLRAMIADGSVRFLGHVSHEQLTSAVYPSADALVITSQWETGPIVAWEAMAQGVAVVSSRYVGHGLEGALSDGGNALLFDIGDVEAAAAALARLWFDQPLRRSLCLTASRLVSDRYSIETSVAAWSQALKWVLARQPVGGADLPVVATAGRLDRWLGTVRAESVRNALQRRPAAALDPGGEWPHAHSKAASDDAFWQLAARTDACSQAKRFSHAG
jgi:glycosyltransferase involved in cell wall biosynthesis